MKLHLLRHAKASHNSNELDIDRKLAGKGLLQIASLKDFLGVHLNSPVVWCSDSTRTRMTFDAIKESIQPSKIIYKPNFYLCNKDTMLEQLWNNAPESDLLIVGHNFGISDLLNYFTGESILLGTCEYVCIDFGDFKLSESSMETGKIITRFRPEV